MEAVAGTALPAFAGTGSLVGAGDDGRSIDVTGPWSDERTAPNHQRDGGPDDDGTVNASVGSQLSTVVSVTSEDTRAAFDETAFEWRYRTGNASRAEALADRAAAVRRRATATRADYERAREAYRNGSITRSEFARRLAVLHARAERVAADARRVARLAANRSDDELAAAGYEETAMDAAVAKLDARRGPGGATLLARFTGDRSAGDVRVALEDGGGVELSVGGRERRSRTVDRDPDGDRNLSIGRQRALSTAREELSEPARGRWALVDVATDADAGVYGFSFRLADGDAPGAASVVVDGSSGTAIRVVERVDPSPGESDCEDRVAALRAELLAELTTVASVDERARLRSTYRERIATVRAECDDEDDPAPVDRETAVSAARETLTEPGDGRWVLEDALLLDRAGDDAYALTFRLDAPDRFGIARVDVNAGTAAVLDVDSDALAAFSAVDCEQLESVAGALGREFDLADPT